jgi:hypothetical protein
MNYKKKTAVLLGVSIVTLVLVYFLSIKKTIDLRSELQVLRKEKNAVDRVSEEFRFQQVKSITIDSLLAKQNISLNNSFQQIVLKKVTQYKKAGNAFQIVAMDVPLSVKQGEVAVMLYPLTVQGDFNQLLGVLDYVESQGLAEIVHFSFYKKKNYSTRKDYLYLKLYLKKLVKNN